MFVVSILHYFIHCVSRLGKDSIATFQTLSTLTPHKTSKSGVTCVALSRDSANERILSGGMDKDAIVSDRVTGAYQ
jgi:hypothetical protein